MRTSNPTLTPEIFRGTAIHAGASEIMTIEGTVNKTFIAVGLTMLSAFWTWTHPALVALTFPALIIGFIVGLVLTFKQSLAPYLTPLYAVSEGVVLGGLSLFFEMRFHGIVFQAISLTFGTLFCLLTAYKSGLIQVSDKLKMGIAAATGGIFIVYFAAMVLSLFHVDMSFLYGNGIFSIGISLFVVAIAALNLLLDFDFIDGAAKSGRVPKYMEWYGAFAMLVTLVWLYMEILRLLSKLQSSSRD